LSLYISKKNDQSRLYELCILLKCDMYLRTDGATSIDFSIKLS